MMAGHLPAASAHTSADAGTAKTDMPLVPSLIAGIARRQARVTRAHKHKA